MPSNNTRSIQPADFNGVMDAPGPGYIDGGLWGDAPLLAAVATNPENYYLERDDFSSFDADDDYVVTQATAGTADVIDGFGGVLQLDCNSTTADQGIQVQHKTETVSLAAGRTIWFEARVKVTDTAAQCQFFAGLSVLDTTLFASGTPSAADYIGFVQDAAQIAASAGNVNLRANSGGTPVGSGVIALPEDTWINLGFKINGVTSAQAYVNGVASGDPISLTGTDNLPTGELAVSFVCQTEGTTDPIMLVDWYKLVSTR